ncbi:MAG: hypothetical protein ABSG89_13190 [Bacteroidales bacterium]|jgi:hypothetical protein
MSTEEKIEQMRVISKNILVATFYKETQVGRSISSSKKDGQKIISMDFKKELLKSVKKLRNSVDQGIIKNIEIRNEIESLSEKTGVSIGQSQKVINVYLKFYCLILNTPSDIIKELDCPLDSTTMEMKQKMKNVKSMKEYIEWQMDFERKFGIRLLRDYEYDLKRMKVSFNENNL